MLSKKSKKSKKSKQKANEKNQNKGGVFRFMYKTFFNVPAWIGFKQIKDSNKVIMTYVKESFNVNEAERDETFDAALERQNITKDQLGVVYRCNARNFYIVLAVILCLAVYAIYLLVIGSYKGFFVDVAVLAFAGVKLFQFSFWNFQIKHKKLGCSFREWFSRQVSQ